MKLSIFLLAILAGFVLLGFPRLIHDLQQIPPPFGH